MSVFPARVFEYMLSARPGWGIRARWLLKFGQGVEERGKNQKDGDVKENEVAI